MCPNSLACARCPLLHLHHLLLLPTITSTITITIVITITKKATHLPKNTLIGSHTPPRSFLCQCFTLTSPAHQVLGWMEPLSNAPGVPNQIFGLFLRLDFPSASVLVLVPVCERAERSGAFHELFRAIAASLRSNSCDNQLESPPPHGPAEIYITVPLLPLVLHPIPTLFTRSGSTSKSLSIPLAPRSRSHPHSLHSFRIYFQAPLYPSLSHSLFLTHQSSISSLSFKTMKTTALLLAALSAVSGAPSPQPQGVTAQISPQEPTPDSCRISYPRSFGLSISGGGGMFPVPLPLQRWAVVVLVPVGRHDGIIDQ